MEQTQPNLNALYTADLFCVLSQDPKNKNGLQYKVEIEKEKIVFSYTQSWFTQALAMQFGLLGVLIKKLVDKKWGKEVKFEAPLAGIQKIELFRKKVMMKQIQTLRFWELPAHEANYNNIYLTINVNDDQLAQVRNALQTTFSKAQYEEVNG